MIVVTGAAGFIGSCIVARLDELNIHDVYAVDWLGSEDKWKNLAKHELGGIILPEQMDDFLERRKKEIAAVIHMGAISTTTERDVDLILRSNQQLSWKLWRFCRDNDAQYIYASSAATYGDGANGFRDDDSLEYLKSLRPLNPYGWSKASFDIKVARELEQGRGVPKQHVGLKFFNVYGPNEYHKGGQKSVVAHIFPSVKKGEPVKLFKSYRPEYRDGWQLRDFVYVEDIVSVIVWMLDHPDVSGLFNVGTGQARSFYDLAKSTWNALGLEEKVEFVEMPEAIRDRYQYFTQADLTRLRSAGYDRPMTSLEDGVGEYVTRYLDSPDMYR
ncbi:MAG: ADP-glyceromanno-heptose 6-epimerase [Succinivibrionaceae bacterium]|nr:ADP-glyceromanno-heptose 6-epimerase [Succinivibrionaceae bacterium]